MIIHTYYYTHTHTHNTTFIHPHGTQANQIKSPFTASPVESRSQITAVTDMTVRRTRLPAPSSSCWKGLDPSLPDPPVDDCSRQEGFSRRINCSSFVTNALHCTVFEDGAIDLSPSLWWWICWRLWEPGSQVPSPSQYHGARRDYYGTWTDQPAISYYVIAGSCSRPEHLGLADANECMQCRGDDPGISLPR